MELENIGSVLRTHVLFLIFSLCQLSDVMAFDLRSAYKRGFESIGQVTESATEIFHDNLTFDDAAINREVEPLLVSLKEGQRNRVERIEKLMHKNRPLAIDLEQQEARRYCDINPIDVELKKRLDVNCKVLEIRRVCELASSATVIPRSNEAKARVAESSRDVSIDKMLKLEKELVDDFRSIQEANQTCSNIYESALMNKVCTDTYRNFFANFREEFVNSCSETSVIEALERFVDGMRDFDHSTRAHLSASLAIHSQSRIAEINLARTIEQINATRLQLEHAVGKRTGIDTREPAERPAQLENYQGS